MPQRSRVLVDLLEVAGFMAAVAGAVALFGPMALLVAGVLTVVVLEVWGG